LSQKTFITLCSHSSSAGTREIFLHFEASCMKITLAAAFVTLFTFHAIAQNSIANTNWSAHVEVPYSVNINLEFKKDSFTIYSEKGKVVESMLFSQYHDSLFLRRISGMMPFFALWQLGHPDFQIKDKKAF